MFRLSRHRFALLLRSITKRGPNARRLLLTNVLHSKPSSSLGYAIIGSAAAAALVWKSLSPLELESAPKGVTAEDVRNHNSLETGIWVAINGQVYDLTEFIKRHPGGPKIIQAYAGKNALAIFNKYHAPDFFEKYLTKEECLGPLIGEMEVAEDITSMDDDEIEDNRENKPPLSEVFRVSDFEYIAKKTLSPTAWCYYSSGADDEITLRENHVAFSRIFFKPRVLVELKDVDMSTTMLGQKCSVPLYCSAAAQAKLGHPDGELSIARGCGKEGVIQMISNSASYPLKDIAEAAIKGQTQWFQLYLSNELAAVNAVKAVKELGLKAIFVTVDTPELGRREKDMKLRAQIEARAGPVDNDDGAKDLGTSVPYGANLAVTWKDIDDIRAMSSVPVAVKGVQSVEDIILAAEKGIPAVVLSNHGGRQLDFSRAPIEVLADAMPILKEKGLDDKIEIYVDGGVRRGSDVIKALCLGAKGVGLGRIFLYANSAYGEDGVRKAIQLLKDEIRIDMRLLGVSTIDELGPHLLDLRNLYARQSPLDSVYNSNYEPLSPPKFRNE